MAKYKVRMGHKGNHYFMEILRDNKLFGDAFPLGKNVGSPQERALRLFRRAVSEVSSLLIPEDEVLFLVSNKHVYNWVVNFCKGGIFSVAKMPALCHILFCDLMTSLLFLPCEAEIIKSDVCPVPLSRFSGLKAKPSKGSDVEVVSDNLTHIVLDGVETFEKVTNMLE